MENWIHGWMVVLPMPILGLIVAITLYLLSKGADMLVEEAVVLSERWGIPRVVIGATVVSLGTTFPEAAVSVWAAIQGRPEIALGNAVGSIICDTGLVLGLAATISPLPLLRKIVNRQGRLQLTAGFLLVISCIPVSSYANLFTDGGVLPQQMGFVFLVLLIIYLWVSIKWFKEGGDQEAQIIAAPSDISSAGVIVLRFFAGLTMIFIASQLLIPAVQEISVRIGVPEGIIGATLVAFGTSLPELVTAIAAVRKGHGELAVGNVIGADILNVLFVAGAAAAVTKGGLVAPSHFFQILFPSMLLVLIIFRLGVTFSKTHLKRPIGIILLTTYVISTIVSYSYLKI